MKRNYVSKIFLILIAFAISLSTAYSAQWYVSTTGDDANSGTISTSPLRTIGEAVSRATASSTINIASGFYDEYLALNKSLFIAGTNATTNAIYISNNAMLTSGSGGLWADYVTVASGSKIQDGINLVVSGGTMDVAAGTFYENLTINKNFIFNGSVSGNTPTTILSGEWSESQLFAPAIKIMSNTVTDLTIENLEITDFMATNSTTPQAGILLEDGNHHINLNNLFIHIIDNPSPTVNKGYGVYIGANSYVSIENSKITNNKEANIFIENTAGSDNYPSNLSIINNEINGRKKGIVFASTGMSDDAGMINTSTISGNKITGYTSSSFAITNPTSTKLNVKRNYWGTCNLFTIDGMMSSIDIDYIPFWLDANKTNLSADSPTTEARNIVFTSASDTEIRLRWVNGNGSGRYVYYGPSNSISSATLGYDGTGNTAVIGGLQPATDYWFWIIEYNTFSCNEVPYQVSNPVGQTISTYNPRMKTTRPNISMAILGESQLISGNFTKEVCNGFPFNLYLVMKAGSAQGSVATFNYGGMNTSVGSSNWSATSPSTATYTVNANAASNVSLVTAYDAMGRSCVISQPNVTHSITLKFPPNAPTLSAPGAPACSTFVANWVDVSNENYYTVEVATSSTFGATTVSSGTVTSNTVNKEISGLNQGTKYWYHVIATNECGFNTSSSGTVTTLGGPIAAPLNLNGTAGCTSVSLTWSAATGATSYQVIGSPNSDLSNPTATHTITSTSDVFSSLSGGTDYYFAVRGANQCGSVGTWTSTYHLATLPTTPNTPTALMATNVSCYNFTATWTPAVFIEGGSPGSSSYTSSNTWTSPQVNGPSIITTIGNYVYLLNGNIVQVYTSNGVNAGTISFTGINTPMSIIGTPGNLYIGDWGGSIHSFTGSGANFTQGGFFGVGGQALTIGMDGYLYSFNNTTVNKYNLSNTSQTFANFPFDAFELSTPAGIVVDASGNLYLTDEAGFLYKYNPSNTTPVYSNSTTFGSEEFSAPRGIVFNGEGDLLIADSEFASNRIKKFTTSGSFVDTLNWSSIGGHFMLSPNSLAVDGNGNLYAQVDDNVFFIQKFTLTTTGTVGGTNKTPSAYNVQVASNPTFANVVFTGSTSNNSTNYLNVATGIEPGLTYYYRVTASNSCGTSSFSNSITVNSIALPVAPTSATASNATCTTINLGWASVSGATGYKVAKYVGTTAPTLTYSDVGTSTTFQFTGLAGGTTYTYVIAAYSACNSSATLYASTLTGSMSTLAIPSAAGTITGQTHICNNNSATFSVPPIANATSYVWSLDGTSITTSSSNTVTVTFAPPSTSYSTVSVYGSNMCGTGTPSSLVVYVYKGLTGNITPATIPAYCANDVINPTLTSTSPLDANFTLSYQWMSSSSFNGVYIPVNTASTRSLSPVITAPGLYYYKLIVTVSDASKALCSATTSSYVCIVVNPIPDVVTHQYYSTCQYSPFSASVSFNTPYNANDYSYMWSFTGLTPGTGMNGDYVAGTFPSNPDRIPVSQWNSVGEKMFKCVVTNNTTQCSNTVTFHVYVTEKPVVTISHDVMNEENSTTVTLCNDITLTASHNMPTSASFTYFWTLNGNSIDNNSAVLVVPSSSTTSFGLYEVTVVERDEHNSTGCSSDISNGIYIRQPLTPNQPALSITHKGSHNFTIDVTNKSEESVTGYDIYISDNNAFANADIYLNVPKLQIPMEFSELGGENMLPGTAYFVKFVPFNGCTSMSDYTSTLTLTTFSPTYTFAETIPFDGYNFGIVIKGQVSSTSQTFHFSATQIPEGEFFDISPAYGIRIRYNGTNYDYNVNSPENTVPLTLTAGSSNTIGAIFEVFFAPPEADYYSWSAGVFYSELWTIGQPEPTFITVNGIGLLEPPTTQAGPIAFTKDANGAFEFNWGAGNGNGRIVAMSINNSLTWTPSAATSYSDPRVGGVTQWNPSSGNDFMVVAASASYSNNNTMNSVTVTNVPDGATIFVKVFEFNTLFASYFESPSAPHFTSYNYSGSEAYPLYAHIYQVSNQTHGEAFDLTVNIEDRAASSAMWTGTVTVTGNNVTVTNGSFAFNNLSEIVQSVTLNNVNGTTNVVLTPAGTGLLSRPSNAFNLFGAKPTVQASNIKFTNTAMTNESLTFSWTNGDGNNALVLVRLSDAISFTPSQGVGYGTSTNTFTNGGSVAFSDGADVGTVSNQKAFVYNSKSSTAGGTLSLNLTGVTASTNVWVEVLEYNGVSGAESYKTNVLVSHKNPNTPKWIDIQNISNPESNQSFSVNVGLRNRANAVVTASSLGYTPSVTLSYTTGYGCQGQSPAPTGFTGGSMGSITGTYMPFTGVNWTFSDANCGCTFSKVQLQAVDSEGYLFTDESNMFNILNHETKPNRIRNLTLVILPTGSGACGTYCTGKKGIRTLWQYNPSSSTAYKIVTAKQGLNATMGLPAQGEYFNIGNSQAPSNSSSGNFANPSSSYTAADANTKVLANVTSATITGVTASRSVDMTGFTPLTTYRIMMVTYVGRGYAAKYTTDTAFTSINNPMNISTGSPKSSTDLVYAELEDMSGKSFGNKVYLDFKTKIEKSVIGFNIYRAEANTAQESDYVKVGSYMSNSGLIAANNPDGARYSFIDADPTLVSGKDYIYKLEYYGADGETDILAYHIITILTTSDANASMFVSEISPNPAETNISFKVELANKENLTVEIRDLTGSLISAPIAGRSYEGGSHRFDIPLKELTSGTYLLTVSNGMEAVQQKFVVVK
ncbi:MAG: hypothetical protein HW421_2486 [Ignavibacteria bacterium]|nr:hypothetical protein [Ignavibacteria bacterium]